MLIGLAKQNVRHTGRKTDCQTDKKTKRQQVGKWNTSDCLKLPYTCGFGEVKEVICYVVNTLTFTNDV